MFLRLLEMLLAVVFFYVTFKWLWKQWVLAGTENKIDQLEVLETEALLVEQAEQKFPKSKQDKMTKKVNKFKENK